MNFRELAWGAFLYGIVTNYDRPYRKLFAHQELLQRLRHDPQTVLPREFRDNVITFLNEWGGRHIRKDEAVASEFLTILRGLQGTFQTLTGLDLVTVDLQRHRQALEATYDSLCQIRWRDSASRTVTLGGTFASKLAHVMGPSLFVMWDNAISYWAAQRGMRSYCQFLGWMQQEATMVVADFAALQMDGDPAAFLSDKLGYNPPETLAKFLDEYNWVKSQRQLERSRPPEWLLPLT